MLYLEHTVTATHENFIVTVVFYHSIETQGGLRFNAYARDVTVSIRQFSGNSLRQSNERTISPRHSSTNVCSSRISSRKNGRSDMSKRRERLRDSLATRMKPGRDERSRLVYITQRLRTLNIVPGTGGNNTALVLGQKQLGSPAKAALTHPALLASNGSIKQQHYDQDHSDVKSNSPTCHSPTSVLPDISGCDNGEGNDKLVGLSKDASAVETQAWLACNRFAHHANTFANFSGADLLRLSRDDIIQICGLADGIRLSNCLHAKRMEPRLTLYVCCEGGAGGAGAEPLYSAVYLHTWSAAKLAEKLRAAAYHLLPTGEVLPIAVVSANGVRVRLCDDVVRHLRDGATYRLQRIDRTLLLTPTNNATMK